MTPEQKRDNDTLSPFDPSSRDVHPASRVRLVLRLNGSAKDDRGSRDESYSEDSDVGESELDDDSDASVFPVRKSTRLAGANSGSAQLPFSPKKTRSRKVIILGGDEETDDNDDDDGSPRATKRARVGRVNSEDEDANEEAQPKEEPIKRETLPRDVDG